MTGHEVKQMIAGAGLRQWQIAEAIGMNEFTLSRKLRREVPAELEQKIRTAVERLKGRADREG